MRRERQLVDDPLHLVVEAAERPLAILELAELPEVVDGDPQAWLDELDRRLPKDTWLGGWSLGGMLASELAARRGEHCCGLLTLASNPSFVAHEQWPSAMPGETFDAFLAGCSADPRTTLKRFSLLCVQGAQDPRGLSRLLLGGAPNTAPTALMAGLELLAQMDTRDALQAFRGPQLHLFAGQDGLVPAEAAGALFALLPDIEIGLIEQASHAFLLENPYPL